MDSAGLGAIIGVSIMACFGISLKLKDVWKKRKRPVDLRSPLIVSKHRVLLVRSHSKIKTILPK